MITTDSLGEILFQAPHIIAHRGVSAYEPENTFKSFRKAIELGAWAVECDVRRCKSGELVLMHDVSIERVSGEQGLVHDMTLSQLENIVLKKGERILTLKALLESLDEKINIIFDLKEEGIAYDISMLIHMCVTTKGWRYEHFFATGFEYRELKKLHDLIPEIRLVPAVAGTPHSLALFAQELEAHAVCFLDFVFSPALLDDVRKRGLGVWVYLSDERIDNVRKFLAMGVDAIMVNAPDNASKIAVDFCRKDLSENASS